MLFPITLDHIMHCMGSALMTWMMMENKEQKTL